MVKEWIKEDKESSITGNLTSAALGAIAEAEGETPSGWDDVKFSDIKKQPASKFVKTKQRWCKNFVAESYSYFKNIEEESKKNAFILIKKAIEKNYSGPFDVKDVINWIGATNLTDGSLQRRILSYLVCLGYLEINHIKIKDSKGKEKTKYIFIKKADNHPCPFLVSKKCDFNWKHGAVTDYFPLEYRK